MAEALTAARRWRGTIRASITKFEAQIVQSERKADLAGSDHRAGAIKSLESFNDFSL